ncbi:hypothetical protein JVU11DRAFT_12055 [Chiua virens]|nr:hypothetical protein JVU11DRAFT_12055 [Chiua virens]
MLSRLVRARSNSRSVNIRFTTPGHANPYFLDRTRFVDPCHPAAKSLNLRNLPSFSCPQFTIRVFPNAILQEPVEFVPINPLLATGLVRSHKKAHTINLNRRHQWWTNLGVSEAKHWRSKPTTGPRHRATWTTFHKREGYRQWDTVDAMRRHIKFLGARQVADAYSVALAKRGRHNVSLLYHTSKKATSKSCVIRRRLRSKMTAAIGLVIGRNADAVDPPEVVDRPRSGASYPCLNLVYRPLQEGERLVLQDWTYLVIPDLAIYKMPLLNLVQAVRKALLHLGPQMLRLESTWSTLPKSRSPNGRVPGPRPRSSPFSQERHDEDP